MPKVLRIIARADGAPGPWIGQFVKAYDPNLHRADGSYNGGLLELTEDPRAALAFPSVVEAMDKWREPVRCECHGRRPWDGAPNRPLTAFTVEVSDQDAEVRL